MSEKTEIPNLGDPVENGGDKREPLPLAAQDLANSPSGSSNPTSMHRYPLSIPPKVPHSEFGVSISDNVIHHHMHHHHRHHHHVEHIPSEFADMGLEPQSQRTAPAIPALLRTRPTSLQWVLAALAGILVAAILVLIHPHQGAQTTHATPHSVTEKDAPLGAAHALALGGAKHGPSALSTATSSDAAVHH